ncbi:hypothetical protein KPATCC21470_8679 [Kitasatospora purpeofusca]
MQGGGGGAPAVGVWSVVIDPQRRSWLCGSPRCGRRSRLPATPAAARETVVAHLAEHALGERLPAHLRSCRCRAAGCPWHRRTGACTGLVVLSLFRRRNGHMWYLADVCEGCTRAIRGAAEVPVRSPAAPAPGHRAARGRRGGGEATSPRQQRLAARAALMYTAASLEASVGPEARLLAVVCTLRVRPSGLSPLPPGLLKVLRIPGPAALAELQAAGWLRYLSRAQNGGPAVFLPELVGRPGRLRAGQWALRALADRRLAGSGARARLAALTVAAWQEESGVPFLLDPDGGARVCGLECPEAFETALAGIGAVGLLDRWRTVGAGLLLCTPAR